MKKKKLYRPSFYMTINALFISLILAVGLVLAWHNFSVTKKIVLTEVNVEYDQTVETVTKDFQQTYKPVFETVRLLSMTSIVNATTLEERLEQLTLLSAVLHNKTEMAALQVGYGNGDYFILRPTPSDRIRSLFDAPDNSAFVVDHITTNPDSGERILERVFFDENLVQIYRHLPVKNQYDPRTRPWYQQAINTGQTTSVAPYLFYFLKEVGTTISYATPGTKTVIGADVTLRQLSASLQKYLLTPSSEIALVNASGSVFGSAQQEQTVIPLGGERFKIAHIDDLDNQVFSFMNANGLMQPGLLRFQQGGRDWHGAIRTFNVSGNKDRDMMLVMLSPRDELLADVISMVRTSLLITLVILLAAVPIASFFASRISKAMQMLAEEAVSVSRFDFNSPLVLQSRIKEVDELAGSMGLMKSTISRFLALIKSLASEQNFDAMLEQITEETLHVSEAEAVLTWLLDDTTNTLNPVALFDKENGKLDLDGLPSYTLDGEQPLAKAARQDDVSQWNLRRVDNEDLSFLYETLDVETIAITAFPLRNRKNEVIGLLCQLDKTSDENLENEATSGRMDFVRTFSGFASVSLESRQLLEMQKRLLDSFILLLAGAIDAKSPYTGGHCQRVPVLAEMLARAACQDDGFFKDFQLDEDGWEALHLAGWLHDCGKVTTPEYVVDKATKLETIYDRIHEVRTRFEVLKRDMEIKYWEKVANGADRDTLREELDRELQQLDDEFNFVATCNLGDELVTPEHVEQLEQIARRTWTRTLDDRVGISWEEEKRKARLPRAELPVEECVLADRIDHLVERTENEKMPEDNPWGFKMTVPEYRYNLGELYNLKVGRGTLTTEERYKISDHVVQTIMMLEKLPYPKHLKDVPAIAGSHHETMHGLGYPKKLSKEEMSLPARMMAIADIFEALTASDRPYKKPKKLSDSIRVMSFFKKDQHIDGELFDLFLRSGIYLEYAREYLDPDQIDEVDIDSYLS